MKRVGVDIGGTFTDLVVLDEATGSLERTKTLTTPRAPEDGFLTAVADQHIDVDEVSHFLHGTTLVTNLIIERSGAQNALITTEGFRDVLEISRSYPARPLRLQVKPPPPLVPRHLRLTIDERVDATAVLRPLDEAAVAAAAAALAATWASTRLPFASSMPMPTRQREAARARSARWRRRLAFSPVIGGRPEIREYERVSTTAQRLRHAAHAQLHEPAWTARSAQKAASSTCHSGGGVIPSTTAERFPIHLLSGPAAGVLAGRFLAATLAFPTCARSTWGEPASMFALYATASQTRGHHRGRVGHPSAHAEHRHPLGRRRRWLDRLVRCRRGPADRPSISRFGSGPACYGRGGVKPTVTDANLSSGSSTRRRGGRLRLDREQAEALNR